MKTIRPLVYVMLGGSTILSLTFPAVDAWNSHALLLLLSLVLLAYVLFESVCLYDQVGWTWMLNPVVLASVKTFIVPFCITNLIFFLPVEYLEQFGLSGDVRYWMNHMLLLVLVASMAMWIGYRSQSARKISLTISNARFLRTVLRRRFAIRLDVAILCMAVAVVSRLLMIRLGVYGYSSDHNQLASLASYRQYLGYADSLGSLVLIGSASQYYCLRDRAPWSKLLLVGVVLCEIGFGFLSGFKSQVVLPIVIVGLCAYYHRRRVPWRLVTAAFAALLAAYAVIEPFRAFKSSDSRFQNTSADYIVNSMVSAVDGEPPSRGTPAPTWLMFLSSMNMTAIGSYGIEYADDGSLSDDSPRFLGNIILAPAYAVIPRFIWMSKPTANIGLWYTRQVMGMKTSLSSTAMGPVTYLYFSGGLLAVLIGFLLMGVVQRCAYEALFCAGAGGVIVFLGILNSLVSIDSSFDTIPVTLIRSVPLLLFAQYVLLRR